MRTHRILLIALLSAMAAPPALAQQAADCAALSNIARNKTYEADDRIIRQCIERGWDPPINWRANDGRSEGVRVGGGGGFSFSGRKPPERPPGLEGAPSSVNGALFNFTMGIPPWRGFPCQIPGGVDLCGGSNSGGGDGTGGTGGGAGGTGGGAASACPIATDTTGTYGQQQTITGGSVQLTCGGAVPLSTYLMSASSSPVGMVATEANSKQVWIYRAGSGGLTQTATATLPTYYCERDEAGEQVEMPAPVAQLLTYNGASGSVAIRLGSENEGEVIDPFVIDPEAEPVKYILVPISNGNPQVPTPDCMKRADLKTISVVTASLTVESAMTGGCEGTEAQCGAIATTPTATGSCDSVTLPQGGACENKILFAVLNRPNLIYTPGSSAGFTAMQGRTAFLATTGSATRLYNQSDTVMYFGAQGGSFSLPEGGVMKLDDGSRLVMNGPATINAGSRSVTLTGGGSLQSASGTTLQNFGAGSTTSPAAALPFVVKVSRSVELPAGLHLPTQPSPFIRLPVDTGQQ